MLTIYENILVWRSDARKTKAADVRMQNFFLIL